MVDTYATTDRAAGKPFLGFLVGTGLALVAWTLIASFVWTVVH